jgi:hypothetical protein
MVNCRVRQASEVCLSDPQTLSLIQTCADHKTFNFRWLEIEHRKLKHTFMSVLSAQDNGSDSVTPVSPDSPNEGLFRMSLDE